MSSPIPARPWESIATDLFELRGKDYLVTVDYYSNFIEVDRLFSNTSIEVIHKLKAHMARYGIPERVVSDKGWTIRYPGRGVSDPKKIHARN